MSPRSELGAAAETRKRGEDCAPRDRTGAPMCGEDDAATTVGRGLTSPAVPMPADRAATPAPPLSRSWLPAAIRVLRRADRAAGILLAVTAACLGAGTLGLLAVDVLARFTVGTAP